MTLLDKAPAFVMVAQRSFQGCLSFNSIPFSHPTVIECWSVQLISFLFFLFFFASVQRSFHSKRNSFPRFSPCAPLKIRGSYLKNGKSDNRRRLTFLSVERELLVSISGGIRDSTTSDHLGTFSNCISTNNKSLSPLSSSIKGL